VSRPTLLPLDSVDREDVLAALARLAGLYLALVEDTLGIRRAGGFMFGGGFDLLIGNRVGDFAIHVTDDQVRMDGNETMINPSGGLVRALETRTAPELDEGFLRFVIGEADVSDLSGLSCIARLATMTSDGDPVTGGQLEGVLTLGGFDRFQAAMGIRGLNVRTPRSFFTQ